MLIHTILGAGGVIADGLAAELIANKESVRLVSRHPSVLQGAETRAADLTNAAQTLEAVKGSSIVYLCAGLPYSYPVWRQQWPLIIDNTIEACKQTSARLIFFDNVYMYGLVDGGMTEETPYDPCSRKGDLRARIATRLMSEVRKGNITATIARSADFYGPGANKTSVLNILLLQRLAAGKRAQWMVNTGVRHSFTYTDDAVKAMYILAKDENSWNQVWHLPTAADPLTGAELIGLVARALQKNPAGMRLTKWMIKLGGLFDRTTAEMYEMLYQYEYDYLFDSSKFEKAYSFQPTAYQDGIIATANAYRNDIGRKG
jgi:nucleoside-diphosphate-sugar epimerase